MKELIGELSALNAKYARDVRRLQDDLTDLLESNDPEVIEAVDRLSNGDFGALDKLQDLIRQLRKQRTRQSASDQRSHAQFVENARPVGKSTSRDALRSWLEASTIESDNFEQWMRIGVLQFENGNPHAALESSEKAIKLAITEYERSGALQIKTKSLARLGRESEALTIVDDVIASTRAISAKTSMEAVVRDRDLSSSLLDRGDIVRRMGDRAAAIAAYQEALTIRKANSRAFPIADFQRDVAVAETRLATANEGFSDDKAAQIHEAAIADFDLLSSAHPERVDFVLDKHIARLSYASFLLYLGRTNDSLRVAETAMQGLENASRLDPTNGAIQASLIENANLLTRIGVALRDPMLELKGLEKSVDVSLQESNRMPQLFDSLPIINNIQRIIFIYYVNGNPKKAAEWLAKGNEVCKRVGKSIGTSASKCEVVEAH